MIDAATLLPGVPEQPGVYRMVNSAGEVLYVGKARNLRKRVASYFQRTQLSPRIQLMIAQVASVHTTATRSEAEALLLENNLIKELQPRFNILYRDDKSYPYILISGDEFPRLGFHRGSIVRGARQFGPFPNAAAVRESIQLIQKVFLLRTCENSVFQNRSRPCLLHQIKRCSAPCVGLIGPEDYATDVRLAELFLKGKHAEVVDRLTARMQAASEHLAFEQAALYRDQIRSLQTVLQRQFVSSEGEEDVDVVVAVAREGEICVNVAMVRGGRHLGDRPQLPRNARDSEPADALQAFLEQHYADHPPPQRILVNVLPGGGADEATEGGLFRGFGLARPRGETERAWVAMAERNAELALAACFGATSRAERRIEALAQVLGLPEEPGRIECFDVSHTMGEATVASCVVYAGHALQKPQYRRYNVRGIVSGDDYGAMRQVLERRYGKVAAGEGSRPDLILIDGGKGQLKVAREVLVELGLEDIAAVGVAKGVERKPGLEELIFPDERAPLHLAGDHPALHLIQEIRDEAHRFAIAGHRSRRAKSRRTSSLESIPGIGAVRRRKLLAQFGGLAGLRSATVEDICRVEGISRKLAEQIYGQLH
jgi:excinuclease ABC subunit C